MPVGIAVSVVVNGERVDPADVLGAVTPLARENGVAVTQFGPLLLLAADEVGPLVALAEPLTVWWQGYGPTGGSGTAVLRFAGQYGVSELTYCRPDLAVEIVRATLLAESGPVHGPGKRPTALRRVAAQLVRPFRNGFTATEVQVIEEQGVLTVLLAGRDGDDTPRSLEFQACDPSHEQYDPDDDEGLCLLTEEHAPSFNGLLALRLARGSLRVRLTERATEELGLRSPALTVRLRLDRAELAALRAGLDRVFTLSTAHATPTIDLGAPNAHR
ncbi:hypothetical protein [Micromonospora auratinigra]|uniref:Uncharacterized protein n=1 Tax=Micromonospora auratinigra TaxID=261654 RepID=A0A1A8ZA67_9ACTN|nr:hypothetical protein [Micromonospora auratinigra]SBT40763.1 hypothetical protein GA0070611_1381 [Micromonospora auratinigra]